jgi:branched-chain amino acid transport system ATP-binding protein
VPAWVGDNLVTIVDGLAFGVLLFTIAVGLSLVFGVMDVLNLAHGALYLVGAYLAVRFVGDGQATLGAFALAGLAAVAVGAGAGAGLAVLTRPLAARGHLDQALLTLGVALIVGDLLSARFGDEVQSVPPPRFLAGSVGIAGRPANQVARAGVALVPQGRRVFAGLTVEQNLQVATGRRGAGPWTPARVYELLPQLAGRRRHRADQLSGGEQQMLAVGRALLLKPRLLLLDEPSDGLAPAVVARVAGLLAGLRDQGLAVLLVEQDLRTAFAVADDIAVLGKGEIVHRAPTPEFRRDPALAARLLGV